MAESLPERIGPYRVVEALHADAGITKYLAREEGDAGPGRDVVLEVISSPPVDDAHAALRVREVAACVKLDHPGIVRTLGSAEHESHLVVVRERFDHLSLSALLTCVKGASDTLPDDAIGHIATTVLDALAHAHGMHDEHGAPAPVVHRAVNPDNVLIGRDGTVKLAGFGLTKILNDPSDPMACLRGDLRYLAPEQAGGDEGTEKVDLYCVALVIWHLLTGHSVLADAPAGSQMKGGLWLVAERKLGSLAAMRADLGQELSAGLDTALELAPEKRNITCAELGWMIKNAIQTGQGRHALSEKIGAIWPASMAGSVEFELPPPASALLAPPRPSPPRPVPPRPSSPAQIFAAPPAPAVQAPEAKAEAPEQKAEAPEAKAEAPEAKAEAPAAKAEAPEVKAEAPEAKAEAPAAKAEAPEVKAEAPEAKAEAPEAEAEAPEAEAPATKAPETKAEAPKAKMRTLLGLAAPRMATLMGVAAPEVTAQAPVEAPAPEAKAEAAEAKAEAPVEAPAPEARADDADAKAPEQEAQPAPVSESDRPAVPVKGKAGTGKRVAIGVVLVVLVAAGGAFVAFGGGFLGTVAPSAHPEGPAAPTAAAIAPAPVALPAAATAPASAAPAASASAAPAMSASASAPVENIGPKVGRLTVRSTASGAAVYVNMTKKGVPGVPFEVPCGRKFVSIGTPKGKGSDATWLAPSQNVTIPCGKAIEITMNPRPIK